MHRLRTFHAPVTALYVSLLFARFLLHLIGQGTTECCASFRALRFLASFPFPFHSATATWYALPKERKEKAALVVVDLSQLLQRPRAVLCTAVSLPTQSKTQATPSIAYKKWNRSVHDDIRLLECSNSEQTLRPPRVLTYCRKECSNLKRIPVHVSTWVQHQTLHDRGRKKKCHLIIKKKKTRAKGKEKK